MIVDNNIILVMLMIGIGVGYNHMKTQYDNISIKLDSLEKSKLVKQNLTKNSEVDVIRNQAEIVQKLEAIDINRDRDYRALADPMYPPLARNPYMDNRINIKTRGDGGAYQQIGSLHKEANINKDGQSPGSNNDNLILPLFGKRTYSGSNHWNYYTLSNNNVKIPLTYRSKNCSDDRGCEELYDSETLNIDEFNGAFKLKIYNYDKPRYIPTI